MNIEFAKQMPMSLILDKIRELLKDDTLTQNVIDHISTECTNSLELVSKYLEWCGNSCTPTDALRWLTNIFEQKPDIKIVNHPDFEQKPCALRLKKVSEVKHLALIHFIKNRLISLDVAKRYLCELKLFNKDTGNTFSALGFKNEDGGYEIRNKFYKGYLSPRDITFIRGTKAKPESIHLFVNIIDYMSIVSMQDGTPFEADAIILNSLDCLTKATPYIKNYGYKNAFTWMRNNDEGREATRSLLDFFKCQNIIHFAQNRLYGAYISPNAWFIQQAVSARA